VLGFSLGFRVRFFMEPLPPGTLPTTLELPQEPSMVDGASVNIVEVMGRLHDSLSAQITSLAQQVQKLHEKEQPTASWNSSNVLRSASHESRRSSAANSLALEALKLDQNHLLPMVQKTKKTGPTGESSISSREFRGKDISRKKERKKKHGDATPSMLELVPVVPTVEALAQQSLEPELPGNPSIPSVRSSGALKYWPALR